MQSEREETAEGAKRVRGGACRRAKQEDGFQSFAVELFRVSSSVGMTMRGGECDDGSGLAVGYATRIPFGPFSLDYNFFLFFFDFYGSKRSCGFLY